MQVERHAPLPAGLLFWPQVPGVLIGAALLGLLFRTRFLPILVLAGMLSLIGGGLLILAIYPPAPGAGILAAAGLFGLGGGATVSPGLYLAALSLPSRMVGRIFALVELVRSVADFLLAPVMLEVARVASAGGKLSADGIGQAVWITLLIAATATALGIILPLVGRAGLPKPDIDGARRSDRRLWRKDFVPTDWTRVS
jgi:hypothetical protein